MTRSLLRHQDESKIFQSMPDANSANEDQPISG